MTNEARLVIGQVVSRAQMQGEGGNWGWLASEIINLEDDGQVSVRLRRHPAGNNEWSLPRWKVSYAPDSVEQPAAVNREEISADIAAEIAKGPQSYPGQGTPNPTRHRAGSAPIATANTTPPAAIPPRYNACPTCDAPPAMRTWADATGTFKIEALMLSASGDNVTLRRRDGKEVTIPLSKLSVSDREFVNQQTEAKYRIPLTFDARHVVRPSAVSG